MGVVARLARNVSPASLGATLDDVSRTSSPPAHVVATGVATAIAGDATRTLGLLAGSAALAVLIAFTNLAGLLIVRSIDRRRELAVRTALGARWSEIARQLLLEAEALVVLGTIGGVLLALWLTPVVGRLALEQFGGVANRDLAVSWRVIGVVAMVAAVSAAICGSLPAFLVARRSVVDVLRRGATPSAQAAEIIGVVGDVKHRALDEAPSPTVYLSGWQSASHGRHVVVRSARPDADVIAAVREEVARLDRDLPVYRTRSMQDVVAASPGVPARRVLTATFMGFALLAVALGGIGLFGVVAHDVASRRTELALRIALGADPIRILSATLGQGAVMVGSGLAVGGLLSIWTARALSGVVVATGHLDVLSVGVPAAVLMIVGAGAVLPAARRAARTDPLIALRSE